MKRFLFIAAVLSLLVVTACKKDKKKSSDPETPSTPVIPSGYSGILSVSNYTNVVGGNTYVSSSFQAYFSNKSVTSIDTMSSVEVDSVSFDGVGLEFQNSLKCYLPSATVTLSAQQWQVKGANGIPDFTTSVSAIANPASAALAALPTQLSKSAGLTLNIDCANTTSGSFLLIAPGTSGSATFPFLLKGGNNTINIPASKLSGLATGNQALLLINLSNEVPVIFSGKRFNFSKQAQVLVQDFTIVP